MKSEHGDPVSFIGKTREGEWGKGEWGEEAGMVQGPLGGGTDGVVGQVGEQRGDGEEQEEGGVKRRGNWAIRFLHLLLARDQSL